MAPQDGTSQEDETTPVPTESSDSSSSEAVGSYINLGTYQGNEDQYSGTNVVLFFNAEWCSTCEVARTNFESSKNSIPGDLTIVVVDFDNSIELRKQYGVTVQHTFVQIGDEGSSLAKWSGSVTIDEIVQNLS